MIPLFPNIGYAEIDSAGTLNDAMGSAKTQLPIQFFKLTDNISGNLTMTNESIHKKIIIDTNGKTITNSSGSPITNNSSIDVELKGSGNVQSTLKTFNTAVTSTSNTGTVTFSNSDSSTLVVASVDRAVDISASGGVSVASGFQGSMSGANPFYFPATELLTLPSNPGSNNGSLSGGALAACQALFTIVGGASMSNLQSGAGFSATVDGVTYTSPSSTSSTTTVFGPLTFQDFGSSRVRMFSNAANPSTLIAITALKIPNNDVSGGSRTFTFTNNLAIPVVLSGNDPFDAVTVAAGATSAPTRESTDGSFDVTGTVSGNNGDSEPYALASVNNGTGDLVTTAYTGTLSASAL